MKRLNVLSIAEHLFHGIEPPLYGLEQEQCNILKCRNKHDKIVNYKVKGTDKDLFLKPLDKLFGLENLIFSLENKIIVDSPVKHITNFSRSVLLVETWLYQEDWATNKTLINDLLSWI